jgi:hypothetical protein
MILEGIPKIHYFGNEGKFNVMVMDLLGKSLETQLESCGKKFSLKSTLMLGKQMVTAIYYF